MEGLRRTSLHQQPALWHAKVAAQRGHVFSAAQALRGLSVAVVCSYGQLRQPLLQHDPRAERKSREMAPLSSSKGSKMPPQLLQCCRVTACWVIRQLRQNRSILSGISDHRIHCCGQIEIHMVSSTFIFQRASYLATTRAFGAFPAAVAEGLEGRRLLYLLGPVRCCAFRG